MKTIQNNKKNLHNLTQNFNQKEGSLYDFIFSLTRYEYKINGWIIFFSFILVQVILAAVLKGMFKITAPYEFYIMSGVFFFISSFALYNMGLKMYLPYIILLEEVQ
ncbi:hypothetical protein LF296_10415 [Acinetobacter vivianii]|uniref:Uncharacterized protein n=1 Tax=Acinetobacter vivianii TaxID=1776742 RepID=A0AAJ6NGF8_9GAMM|nr:hypothetical protein [Acinetobacter vivianii]WDZ49752.1 hypothetical protein LF296_10415 [Acinetobacter vivianii]